VTGVLTLLPLTLRMDCGNRMNLVWRARKESITVSPVSLGTAGCGVLVGWGAHVRREGLAGTVISALTHPGLQVVEAGARRIERDRRGLGHCVGLHVQHTRTGCQ